MIRFKKYKYITGFALLISVLSILIIVTPMSSQTHLPYKYGVLEGGERYSNLTAIKFEPNEPSQKNGPYKLIVRFNQALASNKINVTLIKGPGFQAEAFDNCAPISELSFSIVDPSSIEVVLPPDLEKGSYDIEFVVMNSKDRPAYFGALDLGVGQPYNHQDMACNR